MAVNLAEATRGDEVESIHLGHVAVVDAAGALVAWAGDPGARAYFRSSAKVFQSIPLVAMGAADSCGLSTAELAIATSSHSGSAHHRAIVSGLLNRLGVSEQDLRCGYSPPVDESERARITLGLAEHSQVACECSGEHAGMLGTCRHAGWGIEHYERPEHPLQRLILAIVVAACGVAPSSLSMATDGCSIPTFGGPLQAFARAYAVLADPDGACWSGRPEWRAALHRLRAAMVLHPELIGGPESVDTMIMQATGGEVVAKQGAEGLMCLSIPKDGLGIAITDIAGSSRSLGPAALGVLEQLNVLGLAELDCLRAKLLPPVTTFRGLPVGAMRPVVNLHRPSPESQGSVLSPAAVRAGWESPRRLSQ